MRKKLGEIWHRIAAVAGSHSDAIAALAGVILLLIFALALASATSGCVNQEHRAEIVEAVVRLIETEGQDAAIRYLDQLVVEGRLGAANAEDLKAMIPQGIEKLKEIAEEKQ